MVREIKSADEFKEALTAAGDKLVIVDFFADWCGPCRNIAPTIEEMSKNEFTECEFLKVNVDNESCQDICKENKVTCMPTFIMFKNGQAKERLEGANADKLKEIIKKNK